MNKNPATIVNQILIKSGSHTLPCFSTQILRVVIEKEESGIPNFIQSLGCTFRDQHFERVVTP